MAAMTLAPQRSEKSEIGVVRVPVAEVAVVTPLPAPVRERWEAFRDLVAAHSDVQRSIALREASLAFGSGEQPFQDDLLAKDQNIVRRRQKLLSKLQERLAAAEHNRQLKLAEIQSRGRHAASPRQAAPGAAMVDAGVAEHERNEANRTVMRVRLQRVSRAREARMACSADPATQAQQAFRAAAAAKRQAEQQALAKRALWFSRLRGAVDKTGTGGDGAQEAQLPASLQQRLAALREHHSSRRLQKSWRSFAAERRTTSQLVRAFVKCGVSGIEFSKYEGPSVPTLSSAPHAAPPPTPQPGPAPPPAMVMVGGMSGGNSPRHAEFEDVAAKLLAPSTLRATTALLRRLEQRLAARGLVGSDSAQMLLRRIAPKNAPRGRPLERYPARVFLCAYMVQSHPQMVFSSVGDVEARLSAASRDMLAAFEALLDKMLSPLPAVATSPTAAAPARHSFGSRGMPSPLSKGMAAYRAASRRATAESEESDDDDTGPEAVAQAPFRTLGQMLVRFDELWLEYLDQFVVWKHADAASLVTDLVGMAVKLERSMLRKVGRDAGSERVRSNPDLQAMIAQVEHDHSLLADRIQRLAGEAGMAQLNDALAAARREVLAELSEDSSDTASEVDRSSTRPAASSPPSTPVSMASSSPEPAAEQAPQDAGSTPQQGPTNEGMVWEMLYNPTFKLPTADAEAAWARATGDASADSAPTPDASELEGMPPEALAALLASRAKAIAERAFWDSIEWRFATAMQGGALPMQLAPLMSELGLELSGMVSDSLEAEQLGELYAEPRVAARLASRLGQQAGGANMTALMEMLDQVARTLLAAARPDRAAAAASAMEEMQRALGAALGAQGGAAPAVLAPLLAKALRLLMAQLKLVKLDAANARLSALAGLMKESGAVAYLKGKLAATWQLPQSPDATTAASKLPRTAGWLRDAQARAVPALQALLPTAGLQDAVANAATAGIAVAPANLRSGTGSRSRNASSPAPPANDYAAADAMAAAVPALKPVFPVALGSWRATFRASLLSLVAADSPASLGLPELLQHDGERLHAAQNGLQQLLVLAAGLLIVQQLRQAAGAGWSAEERDAARRRLLVVVADPAMRLSDLVTELASLAGSGSSTVTETQVKNMFVSIVSPESAAFRAIRSGVCAVLLAHLLVGGERLAGHKEAVAGALGRIGASVLADDVAALGRQLAMVAAVNEAVHEEVLQALLA